MITAPILDRPSPAKPAAPAPLHWRANDGGVLIGRDGPDRVMARIDLHTTGGDLGAVAEATREAVETMILTPLRERVAGLESVRRYGVLRCEQQAVLGELADVEVALRRASGARDESLHFSRPGFAAELAKLDAEIAALSARKAEIDARLHALSGPTAAARARAGRAAEDVRVAIHGDAARALDRRRMDLAARLGPMVAGTLTELLGVVDAMHGCAAGIACHGQEVTGDLDRLADEAAGSGGAETDAPAGRARREPAYVD